jgi:hypothetical protein
MKYVIKRQIVKHYGWRWTIVRTEDDEIIQHRKLHVNIAADFCELMDEELGLIREAA